MSKWLVICILSVGIGISLVSTTDARPFFLAGDKEEPPYGYINKSGAFVGIFVEIMHEAFKRAELPFKHNPYPWKRAQALVRVGEADGMITVPTPVRLEFTVPNTVPIAVFQWVAFFRQNHPRYDELMAGNVVEDFRSFKLLDYIGDGWGEANLTGFAVDRSGSLSQVLKRLTIGRGDVFVQSKIITQYTIKNMMQQAENREIPLHHITHGSHALHRVNFMLLVSKSSAYGRHLPRLDAILRQMKMDGTLAAIENRYIHPSSTPIDNSR